MDEPPATAPGPGQPRSEHDEALFARFGSRMRLPIVLTAVLPLFIIPAPGDWVTVVVSL